MGEIQNLVNIVVASLRDARVRGKRGKVMIALSHLAPDNVNDPMIWARTVLTVLDGGEDFDSLLRTVIRESTLEKIETALRVLQRPQD